MTLFRLAAVTALALIPMGVSASFTLNGAPAVSAERGIMGQYTPHQEPGEAVFHGAPSENKRHQERYKNAELLFDLSYSPLTERGSGTADVIDGFGHEMPLELAMNMLIPKGWHVYKDEELSRRDIPQRVSFEGNRSWPDVLRSLGERHALLFHIDWFDRTVMLSKGKPGLSMMAAEIKVVPEPPVLLAQTSNSAGVTTSSAQVKGVNDTTNTTVAASTSKGLTVTTSKNASASGTADRVKTENTTLAAAKINSIDSTVAGAAVGPNATSKAGIANAPIPVAVRKQPEIPVWTASVNDRTFRDLITRWAQTARWTFEPEHWAVQVDIPITASASFRGDFKSAVQQLVSSTELGDTPLQPCFYSNQVVRVVPYNEMCNRQAAR